MLRDLLHLITERADALLAYVPGAQDGDARDTHQARVAARRLSEVLALTGDAGKRLEREVRRLRRALGATRELDVARVVFDEASERFGWPAIADTRVRRYLDEERARRHKAAARALEDVSLSRLRRRIREVGEYAAEVPARTLASRVRKRVASRERDLSAAVADAGAVYDIDKLHAVRLAVKKLRYTLEVAQDALGRRWSQRIRTLKARQALLGELHDLQVLESHVRTVESSLVSGRGAAAAALAAIRSDLDAECRRLHGEWLKKGTR